MENSATHGHTRERILDEAEALFAEQGYEAVSVREITKRAGCNLAAVNYHFGNKKNLYLEVFRSRVVPRAFRIQKVFREKLGERRTLGLKTLIQALATAFIKGPLTDRERLAHHQLMAREMAHPTEAMTVMVEEAMRPFFMELAGYFRPLLQEDIEIEAVILSMLSMFSQILFFNFARNSVSMVTGKSYDSDFKDSLIEHITDFTLHGFDMMQRKEAGSCVISQT